MSALVVIDTGVLLNILNIPKHNERHAEVIKYFIKHLEAEDILFLPMAAILETGDHIADLAKADRRRYGLLFVDQIRKALAGEAPWRVMPFPESKGLLDWLAQFPDDAARGWGLTDMTILKAWETLCERHSMTRVLLWTTDSKLAGYDRIPTGVRG